MNKKQRDKIAERIARNTTNRIKNPFNYKKLFINLAFIIAIFWGMYTVDASAIRINFYDENTLLAIPTVTITDSNGSIYTSDVNGLWDVNLTGAKSFDISKTGYATRPLDFNFNTDANYNFLLNPTSLDSNIQFLVKDENNSVWSSKYLQFAQDKNYNTISTTSYLPTSTVVGQTEFWFTTKLPLRLNSFTYRAISSTTYTLRIYNSTLGDIEIYNAGSQTIVSGNMYTVNFTNLDLNTNTKYKIFRDGGSGNVFPAGAGTIATNKYISDASSTYVLYNYDSTHLSNLNFSVFGTNKDNNNIINSILTSSTGYANASISSSGDYNALLYDENAVLRYTYTKPVVTILKPIDEVTAGLVSPYNIIVSGLLNKSDTDQTSASKTYNVFAGTPGYYTYQLIDYNATTAQYSPRYYQVQIPMGTGYSTTYSVQPYLVKLTDAVIPSLYVLDNLNRFVEGAEVQVLRYINGNLINTETAFTDGSGKISFSAVPLVTYYFKVYYNGVLMNTKSFVPRTSADQFVISIDLFSGASPIVPYTNYSNVKIDLTNTLDSYPTTNPLSASFNISSYYPTQLVSYTTSLIQDGAVIDTDTVALTQTDYNKDYNSDLTTVGLTANEGAYIQVAVTYTENGTTQVLTSYKYIYINNTTSITTGITGLKNLPGKEGRLLFLFLSLIITVAVIGSLSMAGLNMNTNAVVLLGVGILGVFVFIGWISTGTKVIGTDPIVFLYSLLVIFALYRMFSSNQEN